MGALLALLALIAYLLAEFVGELILGTLCYWLGWPWVKLFSLGKYPRHGWRSGHREEIYVQCVGGAVSVLALMAVLGQFGA